MKRFTSILLSLLMLISMTTAAMTNVSAVENDEAESASKEVASIEITSPPTANTYFAGVTCQIQYYLQGMELKVTYSDGKSTTYSGEDYYEFFAYEVEYSGDCITEDDYGYYYCTPKSGDNTVTISYGGQSVDFTIYASDVESAEVTNPPAHSDYVTDTSYFIPNELYGLELTVSFADGTSRVYYGYDDSRFFCNEVTFSGACVEENNQYMTLAPGENTVQIICGEKTADITFTAVDVTGIEVTSAPKRTNFIAGNIYYITNYLDGMEVTVYYSDGTSRVYTYEDDWYFFDSQLEYSGDCVEYGYNMNLALGENVITVSFMGKTDDFTITGVEVADIEVTKLPSKTSFTAGKEYEITENLYGMELTVNYTNGTCDVFRRSDDWVFYCTELEYSGDCVDEERGYMTLSEGKNVITLSLGGKTTELILNAVNVVNIEITKASGKPDLIAGNEYYIENYIASVRVYYSDGTGKTYTPGDDWEFFNDDISYSGDCVDERGYYMTPVSGENVITVNVGGKTADFTLYAYELDSIELKPSLDNKKLLLGRKYYITDYLEKATVYYADGTSRTYTPDYDWNFFSYNLTFSGDCVDEDDDRYMNPNLGENVITVTCSGKTDQITFTGVELTGIEVVAPPEKTDFVEGNTYYLYSILDGMDIRLSYSDKTSEICRADALDSDSNLQISGDTVTKGEYGQYIITPKEGLNTITLTYCGKSADFEISALRVTDLEVTKQPVQYEYAAGVGYNLSECLESAEFRMTFSDGTSKTYVGNDWKISSYLEYSGNNVANGIITPVAGENTVTVTYAGKSADVVLTAKEVRSIECSYTPGNDIFLEGSTYSISYLTKSLEVTVNFTDGTSYTYSSDNYRDNEFLNSLSYSGSCITTDEYDNVLFTPSAGEHTVTVNGAGKTTEFVVKAYALESIEIVNGPDINHFIAGESYYVYGYADGLTINMNFADGTQKQYTFVSSDSYANSFTLTGENVKYGDLMPVIGENVITLTMGGKTAQYTVYGVDSDSISKIEVTKTPNNVNYYAGYTDWFNRNGIEITAYLASGESYILQSELACGEIFYSADCMKPDTNVLNNVLYGENTITVDACGHQAEFSIYGVETPIDKIELVKKPGSKLTAPFSGDMITDTVLRVYFNDGTVTDVDFSDSYGYTYNERNDSICKGVLYMNNDVLQKYYENSWNVGIWFTITEGTATFNIFGKEFTYKAERLIGDANGDGVVSILDVSVIQMYMAKLATDNVDVLACDVDGNGEVNISDASYLQMMMAKLV